MVPRPPIPPEIVQQIETLWVERGKPAITKDEYDRLMGKVRGCPSLRKVQQIIREARKKAGPIPDDPPIIPWSDAWPNDPVQVAALFRVLRVAVIRGHQLTVKEAGWVARLSGLFDYRGLNYVEEFFLAWHHFENAFTYAHRERAGDVLKSLPYTADLDGLLMFSPWAGSPLYTENDERFRYYRAAVQDGLIPDYDPDFDIKAAEVVEPGFTDFVEQLLNRGQEEAQHAGNTETAEQG